MLLQINNISKTYGEGECACTVLKGLNLSLDAGQDIAITGPSGSGKTTLLNLISGIAQASEGELMLAGQNIAQLKPNQLAEMRRHQLGIVFQHHYLLEQCNALENVLIPTLPLPKAQRAASLSRAHELLARAGLADCMHRYPAQLSGGECQRVAVCRALINQPKLLLADEPTGSLDHGNALHLIALLKGMIASDMSLIMVTHWEEAAKQMSRRFELKDAQLHEGT